MAGPERRSSRLSKSRLSSTDRRWCPWEPFGLFSIQDGSSTWAKESPQLCHPLTGSLHREDGRNELRVNGPKDGREKTLMWELENLGEKRKKGKLK